VLVEQHRGYELLIITASEQDIVAQHLAEKWAEHDVRILKCADLSTRGWRYRLGRAHSGYDPTIGDSMAVAGGQIIDVRQISGVLTRLPCIFEHELVHIVPEDRSYVAAEMTALLLAWLSDLECPVLNRPTPNCLSGPYLRHEQWLRAAARAGMPIRKAHRSVSLLATEQLAAQGPASELTSPGWYNMERNLPHSVLIVGRRWFGSVDKELAQQALRLAGLAGADLLAVHFSGPELGAYFVHADVWPDVTSRYYPGATDAVLEYLVGSGAQVT